MLQGSIRVKIQKFGQQPNPILRQRNYKDPSKTKELMKTTLAWRRCKAAEVVLAGLSKESLVCPWKAGEVGMFGRVCVWAPHEILDC